MLMTAAHTLLYALVQTAAFAMFALTLKRLGCADYLRILPKAFFYILTVNAAGTLTFGEILWQAKSRPVAGAVFIAGMAFFIFGHIYLLWRLAKKK